MGTAVTLFGGSKLPAFAQNRELSDTAKALAGSGSGSDRISIKGGVFRLVVGGKEVAQIEERYLDVVIVKAAPKVNRVWYAKKYDGDTVSAPDCWSADGDTPHTDAANPQADRCADCAQNIAGSGEGNSRACRYQQRIAVLLANGKVAADEDGNATLNHGDHGALQLTVPAASLFGKAEGEQRPLQEYARYLVAQKIDPSMLVTRIKFDTNAESPKLWFRPMRWLTEDEFASVEDVVASPEAALAVEVSFGKPEAAAPAPDMAGERPKGKTKPAAPAADPDEDAPAPKAKSKAAPAKAKPAPAADPDDEDAPAPKAKAKPAPAADEDDEPAPAPKAKAKATPPADEDDEPAPAPKAKAKPAPDVDADEEAQVKPKAKPQSDGAKASLAQAVSDWDDD
jgi:hypothetical protein